MLYVGDLIYTLDYGFVCETHTALGTLDWIDVLKALVGSRGALNNAHTHPLTHTLCENECTSCVTALLLILRWKLLVAKPDSKHKKSVSSDFFYLFIYFALYTFHNPIYPADPTLIKKASQTSKSQQNIKTESQSVLMWLGRIYS